MAEITWSTALSVGVTEFDSEHQKLIGYINDLRRAMSEGKGRAVIGPTLARLLAYTKTHFAHEERLLEKHDYPALAAHKREHDLLTAKVMAVQEDYESGKVSLSLELHDFLTDWLKHHILSTDKAYTAFLNDNGVA